MPLRPIFRLNDKNFRGICDDLASRDNDLNAIIKLYGYPPLWNRPNNFESLVHIILEQQVSLASALAALNKLKEKLTRISPENFLGLNDDELKSCYFSRQKTIYTRGLADAIVNGSLNLEKLTSLSDEEVRTQLMKHKGIGRWTADIYLLFVLQRADIFPVGDLAAVNALKQVKQLTHKLSDDDLHEVVKKWTPYQSVAAIILWHHYLSERKKIS